MAETPQPQQQESAPPPPKPEAGAANGQSAEQQGAANKAADVLQGKVDGAQDNPQAIDAAVRDFAADLDSHDNLSDLAQNEGKVDATPDGQNPPAQGPEGQQTNQTDADQSSQEDRHDLDAQQARLSAMMDKPIDEVRELAANGNIDAKRALSQSEGPTSQGAEDFLKQQQQAEANGSGQTPAPEANQQAPENQTAQTPPEGQQTTADDMKEEFVNEAKFKEPSAEERANGAQVEEARSTESEQNEAGAEAVKTPEQDAAELRLGRDKLVADLLRKNPDLDITNPNVQEYLDAATESKEKLDIANDTLELVAGEKAKELSEKMGIKVEDTASATIDSMIKNIESQLEEIKKKFGENDPKAKDEIAKKGWFIRMLKALAVGVLQVSGELLTGAGEGLKASAEKISGKTD